MRTRDARSPFAPLTAHRRTAARRAQAWAIVAVLALGACGGDDDEAAPTTGSVAPVTTTAVTGATATSTSVIDGGAVAPSDTGDLPPVGTGDLPPIGTGDLPPVGTGDLPPLPPVSSDVPYVLTVTVGIDSDPDRVERVPIGSTLSITVTNPTESDEFHLHGYDLGDGSVMAPGQPATFTFVADRAGSFELESHETNGVLMVLEVV